MRLYRAEGPHGPLGYAGPVDVRTGRYFGDLDRALTYCVDDRHLFEVDADVHDLYFLAGLGNPADHILLPRRVADRKTHSDLCPCRKDTP